MNKEKELLKRFYFWGVIANASIFVFLTISLIVFSKSYDIDYNIIKNIFYIYFSPVFFILTDSVFTGINKHDVIGMIISFLFYRSVLITGYGFLSGLIGFKLYKIDKFNKKLNTCKKVNFFDIFKFLILGIIYNFPFIVFFINMTDYYLRLYIFIPIIISSLTVYNTKSYFNFNINNVQENFGETKKRQVLHYSLIFAVLNAATLFCPALFFGGRAVGLPSEVFIVSVLGLFALLLYIETKSFQDAGTVEEKKLFKLAIFSSIFCIIWNICLVSQYYYEIYFNYNISYLLSPIIVILLIIFCVKFKNEK
jgi:hypothetical protein